MLAVNIVPGMLLLGKKEVMTLCTVKKKHSLSKVYTEHNVCFQLAVSIQETL